MWRWPCDCAAYGENLWLLSSIRSNTESHAHFAVYGGHMPSCKPKCYICRFYDFTEVFTVEIVSKLRNQLGLIAPAPYYLALFPGLSTIQFSIACSMQKRRGKAGIVYDMNNHSVYLGRQSDWYHFLCFFDAYNNNSVKWSGGWRYSNSAHCMHKPKLWFTCLWLLHHECYSIAIKS